MPGNKKMVQKLGIAIDMPIWKSKAMNLMVTSSLPSDKNQKGTLENN